MKSLIQKQVLAVCEVLAFCALTGCGTEDETIDPDNLLDSVDTVAQALDSAHTRVIQECSQSMSGSWWTYNETNWPTGTTYGTYAYISNDLGAWGKLLDNTYNYGIRGWWTSCRKTNSPQTNNYGPCSLTYGDLDTASLYDCQGTCTGGIHHRGGQCKPFMNLVAYRSGTYQNPGYAWKSFPNDATIAASDPNGTLMPAATYANIVEGDYLRRPYGHALIIVRKISSSQVIVLDSNWSGGNGTEQISSHSMAFGSGDSDSNLGAYRVLKCAYTGGC
ncbi:MAG: hypothetical protein WCT10_02010 [Patescibacteria group bacterium]|jgi:hypothetical protein